MDADIVWREERKKVIREETKRAKQLLHNEIAGCQMRCSMGLPCHRHFWPVQTMNLLLESQRLMWGAGFLDGD